MAQSGGAQGANCFAEQVDTASPARWTTGSGIKPRSIARLGGTVGRQPAPAEDDAVTGQQLGDPRA